MASVTFTDLTPEQAKTFAEWYEGQGEQDADIWFDIHGVETPYVDVTKEYEINKSGDIVVHCK